MSKQLEFVTFPGGTLAAERTEVTRDCASESDFVVLSVSNYLKAHHLVFEVEYARASTP